LFQAVKERDFSKEQELKYRFALILILTACAVAQNSGEIVVDGIDPAGPTRDHFVHAMIRDTNNNSRFLLGCNPMYSNCRKPTLGGRYSITVLPENAPGSYKNKSSLRITGHGFSAVYFYVTKIEN
jgi:hypothetical protein